MIHHEVPFQAIQDLYDDGQFMAAWEAGKAEGEMHVWPGVEARILAGRLAVRLGGNRLSAYLHVTAYRNNRDHDRARYFYIHHVLATRGALAAWTERSAMGPPSSEDPHDISDYHSQCAGLLGRLRDFARAEEHLARSIEVTPDHSWVWIERAILCECEDRYPEALGAAEHAHDLNPRSDSAIGMVAHCHRLLDQPEEALAFLRTAIADTESGLTVAMLIDMLIDRREVDEVRALFDRFENLTPLAERSAREWLLSKRAACASLSGNYAEALEYITEIDHPYFANVRERLEGFVKSDGGRQPRKGLLQVPFIRQHHMTCAPATLAAISRYWGIPAEHLAVAEEICYDGTPWHSERQWAERNGFEIREFTIEPDSMMALIERGIPSTLTTSDAANGHLQALVGFDEALGTMLIRDPFVTPMIEANAEDFLESQKAVGPRGMAMVPTSEAHRFEGLPFLDAELYDLYHRFHIELDQHDRDAALAIFENMKAIAPDHRLFLMARRSIATYDSNTIELERALVDLLAQYPDDPGFQSALLEVMRENHPRDRRIAWLRDIVRSGKASSLTFTELGAELGQDHRQIDEALWNVRRGLRRCPDLGYGILQLAVLLWRLDRRDEALEHYRFAACLQHQQHGVEITYFTAARALGQTEVALEFLRNRVKYFDRTPQASSSLYGALNQLNRTDEALVVLEKALRKFPDHGPFKVNAAMWLLEAGECDRAKAVLDEAKGHAPLVLWSNAAAHLAWATSDVNDALHHWQHVLEVDPVHASAHRMVAVIKSEQSSDEAGAAYLSEVLDRFPHHVQLLHLHYEWTHQQPAVKREEALRRLLANDPADPWVHRELALNMEQQGRFPESLAAAKHAVELEPREQAGYGILGDALRRLGRREEAVTAYRQAIMCSADAPWPIHRLIQTVGDDLASKKDALDFVEQQLIEQSVLGEGVLTFRNVARGLLAPKEVLIILRRIHELRPDLWHSWSALGAHLTDMGALDEAHGIALQTTERFPRLPRVWVDLADVHRARRDYDQEIQALNRAIELNPRWPEAIIALSNAHERRHEFEESEQVLERGIRRTPLEIELRMSLAQLYRRTGRRAEAVAVVREVIATHPNTPWTWQTLAEWLIEDEGADALIAEARALAESRPTEVALWLRLGEVQLELGKPADAVASLDKAIAIDRRATQVWDTKAQALVRLGHYAEAVSALQTAFPEEMPVTLRGRMAWIEAERGNVTGAIRSMEVLLEESPDYVWGWFQVLEWYERQGQYEKGLRAAERLIWLEPDNPVPYGWLGSMQRSAKNGEAAKETFRRAVELHPRYTYAGGQLIELELEDRNYEAAERTIDIIGQFLPSDQILDYRILLEVARGNHDQSLALLRNLVTNPQHGRESIERAVDTIGAHGRRNDMLDLLETVVRAGIAHACVTALWAHWTHYKTNELSKLSFRQYRWLISLGEPGREAIYRVLDNVGEDSLRTFSREGGTWRLTHHLRVIRFLCRRWRHADDVYWGKVGYVLATQGRWAALRRWMADWRERQNVEPWMMQNLALAALRSRRDRAAIEILYATAKNLSPRSASNPNHRLWCVLACCVRKDVPLARRLLHETPLDIVAENDRIFHRLATAATAYLSSPIGSTPSHDQLEAFDEATKSMDTIGPSRLGHCSGPGGGSAGSGRSSFSSPLSRGSCSSPSSEALDEPTSLWMMEVSQLELTSP
jgi:tetratricopeptide (TPR) repeat protein